MSVTELASRQESQVAQPRFYNPNAFPDLFRPLQEGDKIQHLTLFEQRMAEMDRNHDLWPITKDKTSIFYWYYIFNRMMGFFDPNEESVPFLASIIDNSPHFIAQALRESPDDARYVLGLAANHDMEVKRNGARLTVDWYQDQEEGDKTADEWFLAASQTARKQRQALKAYEKWLEESKVTS